MAPRSVPPPKKNRARFGVKFSLKIVKGDLPPDSEYLDDELDETAASLAVADVDVNEGHEHHLQAVLATSAVSIPTPGSISTVDNYDQLYPPNKWRDPITYIHSTQSVEGACTNALADHEYTYYMDEIDKQWLDKNNQEARGEGTSAHGASSTARSPRKGKDKEPEIGVPVSITEDEFELVMGLLEKLTDQKDLPGDAEFCSNYFLEPLPAHIFASYTAPSWIPAPALLVRIARTIFPHWKHRRSLEGRRLRPTLNFDECDFLNESYVCFRRRDNKPVRKTRAGQVVNHADKLSQLHRNLSQALDIAHALLKRETIKQAVVVESQKVWNARMPVADFLRRFPRMATKADEERLLDKLKKPKTVKSSLLPKVKVLPPTHSGSPGKGSATQATLPSERCAEIQYEVSKRIQQESEFLKLKGLVDSVDDPCQPSYVPRPEKMWVEVPRSSNTGGFVPQAEHGVRCARALRMRYGRGGRHFVDRRVCHPYLAPLRSHRQCDAGPELDEESLRRLQSQWRFDADCPWTGPAEEEGRELVDEFDTRQVHDVFLYHRTDIICADPRYLVAHMRRADAVKTEPTRMLEAALVTDASVVVQGLDGRARKTMPFLTNAMHLAGVQGYTDVQTYLVATGINVNAISSAPRQQQATSRSTPPSAQKQRTQENQAPPRQSAAAATPARPRNAAPLPSPLAAAAAAAAGPDVDVVKAAVHALNGNATPNQNHMPHPHPLQTNGARAMYVPLGAGSNMSFKLPSRSSPLTAQMAMATPSPSPFDVELESGVVERVKGNDQSTEAETESIIT
ncbi:hypothetical protein GGX14DRAFT_663738 [Mycena pura]|uniref:Enhancer of polycomb-like protein n=1 Tax=Mycena pura TaxID=153505 RepID=A0AAD6YKW7_9AGAR|nr:hypothetical protein GGX14DRAFT_663738 [Mycena pura]